MIKKVFGNTFIKTAKCKGIQMFICFLLLPWLHYFPSNWCQNGKCDLNFYYQINLVPNSLGFRIIVLQSQKDINSFISEFEYLLQNVFCLGQLIMQVFQRTVFQKTGMEIHQIISSSFYRKHHMHIGSLFTLFYIASFMNIQFRTFTLMGSL